MGKLAKISRPSGALAMVAVDQREALRGMFANHQSEPVSDSQLTQFKVDVARELTPYASALLVDQEFGIDAIVEQKAIALQFALSQTQRGFGICYSTFTGTLLSCCQSQCRLFLFLKIVTLIFAVALLSQRIA